MDVIGAALQAEFDAQHLAMRIRNSGIHTQFTTGTATATQVLLTLLDVQHDGVSAGSASLGAMRDERLPAQISQALTSLLGVDTFHPFPVILSQDQKMRY